MSKNIDNAKYHLYLDSSNFWSNLPFEHISTTDWIIRRLQFWKYRKKRTMGRPILVLWRIK